MLDFRERPEELDRAYSEYPTQLKYTDRDFDLQTAIKGESGLEWKRPGVGRFLNGNNWRGPSCK